MSQNSFLSNFTALLVTIGLLGAAASVIYVGVLRAGTEVQEEAKQISFEISDSLDFSILNKISKPSVNVVYPELPSQSDVGVDLSGMFRASPASSGR